MIVYGPQRRRRRAPYSIAGEDAPTALYRASLRLYDQWQRGGGAVADMPLGHWIERSAAIWNHRALLAGARHGPRLLYPKHRNPPVPAQGLR